MDMKQPGPKRGSELDMAKGAQAREYARAGQVDARTDEQKLKDAVAVIEHNLSLEVAETYRWMSQQEGQQNARITGLEEQVGKLDGKVSDLGFRIADHDHQLNHGGVTGTAKRWPVVTSQILAGLFNVLVILPAAVWDVLPSPWPFVIAAVLQAVAATIGGRFTESKADLKQLQDGQRVVPLPYAAAQGISLEGSMPPADVEKVRQEMKERFSGGTGWKVAGQ